MARPKRFTRVCELCASWTYFKHREDCLDRCAKCRHDICDGCMADTKCDKGGSHVGMSETGPDDDCGTSGSYAEHVPGLANGRP